MGKEIKIEGRQVVSFPALFGEISGMKDFLNFLIFFVIGGLQKKAFQFDLSKTFFRFNFSKNASTNELESLAKKRKKYSELDLSFSKKL